MGDHPTRRLIPPPPHPEPHRDDAAHAGAPPRSGYRPRPSNARNVQKTKGSDVAARRLLAWHGRHVSRPRPRTNRRHHQRDVPGDIHSLYLH
jgi:hypothetical protein